MPSHCCWRDARETTNTSQIGTFAPSHGASLRGQIVEEHGILHFVTDEGDTDDEDALWVWPHTLSMILLKMPSKVPPFLGISVRVSAARREESMPRQKRVVTIIHNLVQQEVRGAIQSLLGSISTGR